MKRCPECRRDYYDETLSFCLDDGAALLEGPATDEPATAILSEPPAVAGGLPLPSESQTRILDDSHTATRRNSLIAGVAGILLVTALGVGSYLYYGRGSTKQIDSIAVMPFVNESGNADLEYLSDGMTETLISRLSQLPNLGVQARSSVFPYKGKNPDARTVGKDLNVQAILNGRVVQRGDGLTLYLELVDAQSGNQIWGEQYVRKQADLVALQSEIARDVLEKLKIKLSGEDERKLVRAYTENPEAYQLYLNGRFHWNKRTEKDIQRATAYFQQAIALDPDYALAYAGLADTYAAEAVIANPDPTLRQERSSKAREAALRAISLDDNLAEAHTALGTILTNFDYDFARAEREYRRAIDQNPTYADAHYWYAQFLSRLGRWEESSAEYRRALELEPLNLVYQANYGGSLAWARRYDEATAYLEKTRELDEKFGPTLGNLTNAYQLKGDYAKAVETRAREYDLSGHGNSAAMVRDAFAKGGWEGYLRYMTGDNRPATVPFYGLAVGHTALGERDKAFAALNRSYKNREALLLRLKVDPRLDPLRDDARYQELLKKIGFPE